MPMLVSAPRLGQHDGYEAAKGRYLMFCPRRVPLKAVEVGSICALVVVSVSPGYRPDKVTHIRHEHGGMRPQMRNKPAVVHQSSNMIPQRFDETP